MKRMAWVVGSAVAMTACVGWAAEDKEQATGNLRYSISVSRKI